MKNAIFILILFVTGCSTNKNVPETKDRTEDLVVIEVNIAEKENISFIITNTSNKLIYIYQPHRLHIERFENGTWENVRILYCPCGAPCAKPPEKVDILVGGIHTWEWDKYESWCGEKNEFGIPETIKKMAKNGKYRLRVLYSNSNNEQEVLYKKFELR